MNNSPKHNIVLHREKRILDLLLASGERCSYPYIWLRHSARFSHGLQNDTSIKIDLLPDDPESLEIEEAKVESNLLKIVWNDTGVQTVHDLEFLKAHSKKSEISESNSSRFHWDKSSARQIAEFDYQEIETPERLLALMLAIRDSGIVFLKNVPAQPGSIESVAEKFGPIHVNNYGRIFDVQTEKNTGLGSNTGAYLGPHTDESYRHCPPDISFFHCLCPSPGKGGESILVDGFHAASVLKSTMPECFHTLSTVPVFWQRRAIPKEDMCSYGRVIATDSNGKVQGIRFTDRTIPPQDAPVGILESLYRALNAFRKIVNSEELVVRYKMQAGDLHIFDNHRVLHGRTQFDPALGRRHLQQCSVNRDEYHSSLRILAHSLNHPAQFAQMVSGARS